MKVFVLGLDGATWDVLEPLARAGTLPNLARLMAQGASGTLELGLPAAQPGGLDGVMTGKNSGKHGVFEFLEYAHDPLERAGQLVAGDQGRAGLGDRRPARQEDGGRRRADELPAAARRPGSTWATSSARPDAADFASDPAIFAELEQAVGPYRPWSTAVHDGGNEAGGPRRADRSSSTTTSRPSSS